MIQCRPRSCGCHSLIFQRKCAAVANGERRVAYPRTTVQGAWGTGERRGNHRLHFGVPHGLNEMPVLLLHPAFGWSADAGGGRQAQPCGREGAWR